MEPAASRSASAPTSPSTNIEQLLSRWPVASTLIHHLPVGDLITLARLSVTLRALLHGFELPPKDISNIETPNSVRPELHIGHHGTAYWQRLKDLAPFECSSRTHTKGPPPKPCRYCSRPICDACMVRDSMFKGHENTFPNRVRYLCRRCWESGNNSQTHRYPITLAPGTEDSSSFSSSSSRKRKQWFDPSGLTRDYCTCTLKTDGILCLECKDIQNSSAQSTSTSSSASETRCHGQSCASILEPEDKDRRRICLWCDKALPRQLGGTTRHHWNQKIIEARARNAASRTADVEEWNRKRLKERTMSRREMRGDDAVRGDPDADIPQLVRHLDTINYKNYMVESAAPSPETVFASKRGYWRYSRAFLLAMKPRCAGVRLPSSGGPLNANTPGTGMAFARTNAEKAQDLLALAKAMNKMPKDRLSQWCAFRAVILGYLLEQNLSYEATRQLMRREHDFEASLEEYHEVMHVWTRQEQHRKSLEDDADATAKGKGVASFNKDAAPSLRGKTGAAMSGKDTLSIKVPQIDSDDDATRMCSPGRPGLPSTNKEGSSSTHPSQSPRRSDEAAVHLRHGHKEGKFLMRASNQASSSLLPSTVQTAPSSSTCTDLIRLAICEDVSTDSESEDLSSLSLPVFMRPDEHTDPNEEPPPYDAEGWTWPDEVDDEHDHGQAE
ncbi:hypothetical protein PV04_06405 [Phialophora macrospora]|uniref:Clr5 domain-containing protein n=1 Tax=Phialophora macrospora TaxID=1851006 RepID=A0A0D2FGE8_9EURO|nr:hypothetical protein PV04_06405 [Phialophora macrospora]